MNKNKILYCLFIGAFFVVGLIFQFSRQNVSKVRYHQHQENQSEKDLGICPLAHTKEELCTHLPIISIETKEPIPGKTILNEQGVTVGYEKTASNQEETLASIRTYETKDHYHHLSDKANMEASALIRKRGNSSRSFDKPSYKITFCNKDDTTIKENIEFLGMYEDSEWALHGPFLDKTLIRNYMVLNILSKISPYTPNVRFCELVVNGEYQGIYLLMETIKESESRLDLTNYEEGDQEFSYIFRIEPKVNTNKVFNNYSFYTMRMEPNTYMEVKYPTIKYQTSEMLKKIEKEVSQIEYDLFSLHLNKNMDIYDIGIDVDSFVDYYIINEFLLINDSFSASTYFYKDARGKLTIGPLWDYNNAFDNYFTDFESTGFILNNRGWFAALTRDATFTNLVIQRYKQLRENILSDEYFETYANETIDWLGSAIDRNYQVWGYSFDINQLTMYERKQPSNKSNLTIEELNPKNYEEAINMMIDFMKERGAWLDENIESLNQYSSDSRNSSQNVK